MNYSRELKNSWKAKWIWHRKEEKSKNVWLCFNKKVTVDCIPEKLVADIAAENKYWLYINGEMIIREGSVKRGPTPTGCFFDKIDIAPYLKKGENLISILVWYWGKEVSYSSADAGQGGLLFEAENENFSILSDNSWSVMKNPAFKKDKGKVQPNYRIPESNVYYDARDEISGWNSPDYDFSSWDKATEYTLGGEGLWGETYSRDIPFFKDFGLKDYENSYSFINKSFRTTKKITMIAPYNAQLTPYLEVEATKGKKIVITTENTPIGSVHSTYVTTDGIQSFESPAWFNGERITYRIPANVKILGLKYRESGYNTEFAGNFRCEKDDMNSLWQKSLRTLYVTMRDTFMDCPDRERAQWWGDATNEMIMSMYSLDTSSYLLYRKGVRAMISHIEPEKKVLRTVIPINGDYFELPMQQLAGICGFLTYYLHTGETELINDVYDAVIDYLNLWETDETGLVKHKKGSWDWFDWGEKIDKPPIENAWYYYALSCTKNMAEIIGDKAQAEIISKKMKTLYSAFSIFWTGKGYRSDGYQGYDDRANAVAVLSGLCPETNYGILRDLLFKVRNSSPYMEYYVLEALCRMGEFASAERRMCERYKEMIDENYSTLWENWNKHWGTMNHAWTGGPLVIMSKHIAGIKPLVAGYEKTEIRPQYGLHEKLECTVPTVRGVIDFRYNQTVSKTTVTLDCPDNMNIELHLPSDAEVVINGEKVDLKKNLFYHNCRFIFD